MENMEGTRMELADKVEKLEQKLAGTVETVTDTVASGKETIADTVESVKESIAGTVEAVTGTVGDTVETVTESVHSAVDSVTEFFNVPHQVERHPWLMMGGSVLLGYLAGRLLTPRRSRSRAEAPATLTAAAYHPSAAFMHGAEASRPQEPRREEPAAPSEDKHEGLLSHLGERFGGELGKLKGMAIGTLLGAARDMVSQWVPETLKGDVTQVINGFTSDLGGQVINGPVFGGSGQEEQSSDHDGPSRGNNLSLQGGATGRR
jgi:ElaB/YqjD/DUF883 family membrane-anchored ribosome-binding protein